jgi:hypothetical protein
MGTTGSIRRTAAASRDCSARDSPSSTQRARRRMSRTSGHSHSGWQRRSVNGQMSWRRSGESPSSPGTPAGATSLITRR